MNRPQLEAGMLVAVSVQAKKSAVRTEGALREERQRRVMRIPPIHGSDSSEHGRDCPTTLHRNGVRIRSSSFRGVESISTEGSGLRPEGGRGCS